MKKYYSYYIFKVKKKFNKNKKRIILFVNL